MHSSARHLLILVGVSLLGVITHLVPHSMGVSTVGAIGMLCAAYLPRHLIGVPVFVTIFVADAVNGFYALLAMSFVYLGHVAAAYATAPTLRAVRPTNMLVASLVSALAFYLISNVTPMAMGFYPPTVEGWVTCYLNGLPFLWRSMLANLIFGGFLFGVIWLVGEVRAHRFTATQRY